MLQGISFYTVGAATWKAWKPISVFVLGTGSLSPSEVDRSVREETYLINLALRYESWPQ